jgi:putative transposase
MHPSDVGTMVSATWHRIPDKYPEIGLDALVVMPDHLHAIVFTGIEPNLERRSAHVGDAIRWFKNVTLRHYRDGVMKKTWPPYEQHLWQAKYYDHIIRTPRELERIRAYIDRNPERWSKSPEYQEISASAYGPS